MTAFSMKCFVTALALFLFSTVAHGHSWIEQLMVIGSNGTFIGSPGFPRGNVLRTSPTFSDPTMVNLIPPNGGSNAITSDMAMCKDSQQSETQTANSPRLQAAAGAAVALRYQENGHVTLPQNQPGKPDNRGTLFVYGTTQPQSSDTLLGIHGQWTVDGSGGDKRGVLLSTQNFDDGQCYQVNGGSISQQRQKSFQHEASPLMGSDLWCQQDVALPTDAPSGKPYTLYWVWDWPTAPGTAGLPQGKNETYTTCMDIDVVAGSSQKEMASGSGFVASQPLDNAAVSTEFAQLNNPTAAAGSPAPLVNSSASAVPTVTSTIASSIPVKSTITTSAMTGLASAGSPAQPSESKQAPTPAADAPSTVYETVPFTITVTAAPKTFATKLRRQAASDTIVPISDSKLHPTPTASNDPAAAVMTILGGLKYTPSPSSPTFSIVATTTTTDIVITVTQTAEPLPIFAGTASPMMRGRNPLFR